jgi:hypothetical protein
MPSGSQAPLGNPISEALLSVERREPKCPRSDIRSVATDARIREAELRTGRTPAELGNEGTTALGVCLQL